MRIIKLGRGDEEMQSRDHVIAYFRAILWQKARLGKFGITQAKRNMPDIHSGTLLVFTFEARCMFVAKASGAIDDRGGYPYIPLAMTSIDRVNVPLHDLEHHVAKTPSAQALVNTRQWPHLPDDLTERVLRFLYDETPKNDGMDSRFAEEKLTENLFSLFPEAGRRTGYWGRYYLRSLMQNGTLATARRMLRPKRLGKVDKGLQKLIVSGLARELSVEAIVLRSEVSELFTAEELLEAKRRLEALPNQQAELVAPEENFSDTFSDENDYFEGAVKKVYVNKYERNADARKRCLKHYGHACSICRTNFEKRYGAIGKGFIHVHHLRELNTIAKRYKVDPIKDLIPVCPNCHSMLHSKRPARSVETVRAAFIQNGGAFESVTSKIS